MNFKVGQTVLMQSGDQLKEATVVEITEEYIAAKPIRFGQNERPWMIRFKKDGKQFSLENIPGKRINTSEHIGDLGVYEWYEAEGFTGWWREDPFPRCGEGWIPWELVLNPSSHGVPVISVAMEC